MLILTSDCNGNLSPQDVEQFIFNEEKNCEGYELIIFVVLCLLVENKHTNLFSSKQKLQTDKDDIGEASEKKGA